MTPLRTANDSRSTAYTLSLLSEYTQTLDSLPRDLSRNFADLRELDAVLSSSMSSITTKIHSLIRLIEDHSPPTRLLPLLTDIAEDAARLKLGGEDKIRVACQAADTLKAHNTHLRALLERVPGLDPAFLLDRHTTYPHVAPRSFPPIMPLESGRRRRAGGAILGSGLIPGSQLDAPTPRKRRAPREDDGDHPRSPRKDKTSGETASGPTPRPRNNGRVKRPDRPASPAESVLTVVTSAQPQTASQTGSGPSRLGPNTSNRSGNTTAHKRPRPSANTNANNGNNPLIGPAPPGRNSNSSHNPSSAPSRREFEAPPTSSSSHPSLPLPYGPSTMHYDAVRSVSKDADWTGVPHGQLEGPGMPVARGQSHPALSLAASSALGSSNTVPIIPVPVTGGVSGGEGTPAGDGGDGDGDGDDRTYCFCDGVSYGEMIGCDDIACEREWFHLACIGLTVCPEGLWFCNACLAKRNKRNGRGGRKRAGGGRSGRSGAS